jgi:hypothetical protein
MLACQKLFHHRKTGGYLHGAGISTTLTFVHIKTTVDFEEHMDEASLEQFMCGIRTANVTMCQLFTQFTPYRMKFWRFFCGGTVPTTPPTDKLGGKLLLVVATLHPWVLSATPFQRFMALANSIFTSS